VNGLPVYFRLSLGSVPDQGTGVVLIHGLSVSSWYMVPTAERLAPYYRVYLPDLPGFGKSGKPSHILNIAGLSDVLAAWMQVMGLQAAVLVGNSMGCQTIINFALRYPERITHAVLIGPTMDPRARTIHQAALRLLLDAPCEPFSCLPVLLREYATAGLRRTIRTLRYAFEDRIEEHLPHVSVPTLVVRGARDPIVSQTWAEEVNRLLPDSRLVVIEDAGHAVNFNSPKPLVEVIQSFLNEDQ
jgi:2-hydroxy-6-oxonona-2,4-dienedioate hydrolase